METNEMPDIETEQVTEIVRESNVGEPRGTAVSDELNRWSHKIDYENQEALARSAQANDARTVVKKYGALNNNLITDRILGPIEEEIRDKSEGDPDQYGNTVSRIDNLFSETRDKASLHEKLQREWDRKNGNA